MNLWGLFETHNFFRNLGG
uniref:Uncharacterized protein n=1 Tax=Arundo donax TaxID=35708 RepID=A0A0A8ZJP7_ARUDO